MVKTKTIYTCTKCGAQFSKWMGQCTECGVWNTIIEETSEQNHSPYQQLFGQQNEIVTLNHIELQQQTRMTTHLEELDRVLGGGLIEGAVILLGGDPGIGKSTLLLQVANYLKQYHCLYVSGEESAQQIALRAKRLQTAKDDLKLLTETQLENILSAIQQEKPKVLIIDSIQTIFSTALQSAPGSVSQVRECAAQLSRYAKQTGTTLFLVGHVTKEGAIAGPRVLEHMVDTVLYFEGDRNSRFRLIRAVKNRFGAVNELGIFGMTDKGLKEVNNPSAIFLSGNEKPVAGNVITATWEGSRPLLVAVQALVDQSYLANPRRVTVGLDSNRLSMLLAVLHRHGGLATYNQDVFANVVGGVRIVETAADLAVILAVISSFKNRPIPNDTLVFGEVGLGGELRPVQNGQERLQEAAKHGFKQAIIPKANAPKRNIGELKISALDCLSQAIND